MALFYVHSTTTKLGSVSIRSNLDYNNMHSLFVSKLNYSSTSPNYKRVKQSFHNLSLASKVRATYLTTVPKSLIGEWQWGLLGGFKFMGSRLYSYAIHINNDRYNMDCVSVLTLFHFLVLGRSVFTGHMQVIGLLVKLVVQLVLLDVIEHGDLDNFEALFHDITQPASL